MVNKTARIIIGGFVIVAVKIFLDFYVFGIQLLDLALAILIGFSVVYLLARAEKKKTQNTEGT